MEASVAEAIEADCRIPLGGKEENIRVGTTAVATVDIAITRFRRVINSWSPHA